MASSYFYRLWVPVAVAGSLFTCTTFSSAQQLKVIVPAESRAGLASIGSLLADRGSYLVYQVPVATLKSLSRITGLQPRPDFDRIELNREVIDTAAGAPVVPSVLSAAEVGDRLMLIQFSAPPVDSDLALVEGAGAEIVQYVPQNAYIIWVPAGAAGAIEKATISPVVQYYGSYHPYYALSPRLDGAEGQVAVTVQFYNYGMEAEAAANKVAAEAARVIMKPTEALGGRYINVRVVVAAASLASLASLPGVVTVEPYVEPELCGERQDQVMAGSLNVGQTGPGGPGYLSWLGSRSFPTDPDDYPIIDIVDDGFDTGNAASPGNSEFREFNNPARPSRCVYAIIAAGASGFGPEGEDGHGNINCSIVGGYNDGVGSPDNVDVEGYHWGLGVSPYGRIASTRIFGPSGWSYPDEDQMVSDQYDAGVRTTSNSWGADNYGGYDTDAQAYDRRTRDAQSGTPGNQEMLFVFAAGNAGSGANSVGTPGTAKNVITVGASENEDTALNYTDGCAVGPSGADNIQDIIDFSSRGPCDDGRVKPEVVGPGTHIHGAASYYAGYNGSGVCDMYNPAGQTKYAESSGTSHSTPAVAGFTSLITNFLSRVYGITDSSPALRKAGVINSSRFLTGVSANDDLPSNNQGFGLINLGLAFDQTVNRILVDQTEILHNSGDTYHTSLFIDNGSEPFRATLTWTDAPGPTSGYAYVNDLDLEVEVGGVTYRGNNFTLGVSQSGGSADPRNNTECVFLPAGLTGVVNITVGGTTIAGDGVPGNGDATDQDFALAIYNVLSFTPTPTPEGYKTPTPSPTSTPTPEGYKTPSPSPSPSVSYCDASGGCDEYISRVQFNTIDNSSGCDYYADYTALSTVIMREAAYGITVTNPNPYEGDYCDVWVDWNQNKDFYDAGEETTLDGGPEVFTGTITGPAGALLGETRLRIRLRYNESVDPCGDFEYGEVEDYTVVVVPLVTPTPTPEGYKTPTPSPTSTATPEGYHTPTPTMTPTITPTPTMTPPPTMTPTITPTPTMTPEGYQLVYSFPLDTDPDWSAESDWAFGQPTGGGSHSGDPTGGYTGSNVYGYNLAGDYTDNLPARWLTTNALDCSQLTNISLRFARWLGVESASFDRANIEISTNGSTWSTIWEHTGSSFSDSAWSFQNFNLSPRADGQSAVFLRWGMGPTDSSITYPGWNIDDIEIWGVWHTTPTATPTPEGYKTPTPTPRATMTMTPTPRATMTMTPTPRATMTMTPTPRATMTMTPTPGAGAPPWICDYNGDGTSDIAIFRGSSGLWAVRGVTRVYFGGSMDETVPGDYNGDRTTDIGIFRPASGLWALRGVSRAYFGGSSDFPQPGDYDGDGTTDIAIFRTNTGLWALRGVSRVYFGGSIDEPVPGYYDGDGTKDIGIFRPASGLWALRTISRIYFGGSQDDTIPGDYDGDGNWDIGIFRPASGLWAIRGVTRAYFGGSLDSPGPADYTGSGTDSIGIFRSISGLWAVRGVTRAYFGSSGDIPVTR